MLSLSLDLGLKAKKFLALALALPPNDLALYLVARLTSLIIIRFILT